MAKNEVLPDSFDVIVCGTGLTESMIAASLSRIGKKVLHIDRNDYYGSQWATFNFKALLDWIEKCENKLNATSSLDIAQESVFNVPLYDFCVSNIIIESRILPDNDSIENHGDDEHEEGRTTTTSIKTNDLSPDMAGQSGSVDDKNGQSETGVSKENRSELSSPGEDVKEKESMDNPLTIENTLDDNVKNELSAEVTKPPQSIISQAKIKDGSSDISLEDFEILSRKFNLDITSKFLFSAGPLVQTIIKANIAHYAEFKVVNRILMCTDKEIIEVPCNRADVFSSSFLSMIEKRMLMKFLTLCVEFDADSEEIQSVKDQPFQQYLKSKRLSESLQKFVIYSIAMVKPQTPTLLALRETQTFLKSLGRFGKSPFIWPLFGVGELPQAFCRMSAVFGGLYCLRTDIKSIVTNVDSNECTHVIVDEQKIECQNVVMESSYVPQTFLKSNVSTISKCILITNKSLVCSDEENISFLTIPPLPGRDELVQVIELGPASSACPAGLYVLYLTCISNSVAIKDLKDYVNLLTEQNETTNKPKLLWSLYFNHLHEVSFTALPKNVMVTSMPGPTLGFSQSVEEAEKIFKSICPDEEFMLKVPDPEDIIWEHDEVAKEEEKQEDDKQKAINEYGIDCQVDDSAEKNPSSNTLCNKNIEDLSGNP